MNNNKEYTYYMRLRPPAPGCQPRGTISINSNRLYIDDVNYYYEFWGSVTYNRPLTEKEIDDYDLEYIGEVAPNRIRILD